jgi:hypothetical protein
MTPEETVVVETVIITDNNNESGEGAGNDEMPGNA